MKSLALFILFLTVPNYALHPNHRNQVIVWNVGQGQWITYSTSIFCLHIDAGGEFAPLEKIKKECKKKINAVAPSHLDYDHISYVPWIYWNLPKPCLVRPLNVPKNKQYKLDRWDRWKSCYHVDKSWQRFWPQPKGKSKKNSNSWSAIDVLNKHTLLTGDSTQKMEKTWLKKLNLKTIKILLLGHHGSVTSTSEELMSALPQLSLAIASARKKRYGHPHKSVKKRLRRYGISLLRTEIWGNMRWRVRR